MNPSPQVSICIPAYRRPRELQLAIESVVSQDFEQIEVVVGDDSGDLEPVASGFGDSRVHYFRNPRRLGMAGNWNAVLDRAGGRFLALLMDDDRLLPGFVRSTASLFEQDPSLGVVFTNHLFDDGERPRERRCSLAEGRYEPFLPHLLEHMPVAVSATLMRREVWEMVRPLPDLNTADLVMHVRAALAGSPFYYLDKPLMAYRTQQGQLSAQEEFRDDVVAAWEQFEFEDPRCERLRQRRLAVALSSRAAAHLKHRRFDSARADISRAIELDGSSVGMRGRIVRYLANHPILVPPAIKLLGRAGLVSRRS